MNDYFDDIEDKKNSWWILKLIIYIACIVLLFCACKSTQKTAIAEVNAKDSTNVSIKDNSIKIDTSKTIISIAENQQTTTTEIIHIIEYDTSAKENKVAKETHHERTTTTATITTEDNREDKGITQNNDLSIQQSTIQIKDSTSTATKIKKSEVAESWKQIKWILFIVLGIVIVVVGYLVFRKLRI